MSNKTSKFKPGDIVRVLNGVRDPDFQTNMGGWSGKVEEVDLIEDGSWLYTIVWDQDTLSVAGDDYESECERNNLDFERIYLEEKDLELIIISGSDNNDSFLA
jgi:hypothetical protein